MNYQCIIENTTVLGFGELVRELASTRGAELEEPGGAAAWTLPIHTKGKEPVKRCYRQSLVIG